MAQQIIKIELGDGKKIVAEPNWDSDFKELCVWLEDKDGNMKVTEVNIRHMAYTGVMAHVGFDLIEDTIRIMEDGNADKVARDQYHHYDKPYIFLRDVDVEPIVLESEEIFDNLKG